MTSPAREPLRALPGSSGSGSAHAQPNGSREAVITPASALCLARALMRTLLRSDSWAWNAAATRAMPLPSGVDRSMSPLVTVSTGLLPSKSIKSSNSRGLR